LIVGRDPSQIAKIKHDLEFQLHNFGRNGAVQYGIAAIDIALWDLLGKSAMCRYIAFVDRLETYASLMRYGTVDGVVKATRRAVERGYRYIKLHEIGIEEIRAAVKAAGADAKVMLDTNCPWSVPEAIAKSHQLKDLGLYWFEEPVWPPENFRGLAAVRSEKLHRIAAGENTGSLHDFMAMISEEAIDIAQPDVAKTGGLTEVIKIAALCEAHGIEFAPHCALFGPGQVATIHLTVQSSTPPFRPFWSDRPLHRRGDRLADADPHYCERGHGACAAAHDARLLIIFIGAWAIAHERMPLLTLLPPRRNYRANKQVNR
jgi:D-galactarolactone cycloisomerase